MHSRSLEQLPGAAPLPGEEQASAGTAGAAGEFVGDSGLPGAGLPGAGTAHEHKRSDSLDVDAIQHGWELAEGAAQHTQHGQQEDSTQGASGAEAEAAAGGGFLQYASGSYEAGEVGGEAGAQYVAQYEQYSEQYQQYGYAAGGAEGGEQYSAAAYSAAYKQYGQYGGAAAGAEGGGAESDYGYAEGGAVEGGAAMEVRWDGVGSVGDGWCASGWGWGAGRSVWGVDVCGWGGRGVLVGGGLFVCTPVAGVACPGLLLGCCILLRGEHTCTLHPAARALRMPPGKERCPWCRHVPSMHLAC